MGADLYDVSQDRASWNELKQLAKNIIEVCRRVDQHDPEWGVERKTDGGYALTGQRGFIMVQIMRRKPVSRGHNSSPW